MDERTKLTDLTMTWPDEAQGTSKWSVRGGLSLAVLLRLLMPDSRTVLREDLMRHIGDRGHASMVFQPTFLAHVIPSVVLSYVDNSTKLGG